MNTKPIPQVAPATALVQLLKENPHLPLLDWELSNSGCLSGYTVNDDVDMRPVIGAYADVLGGEPTEFVFQASDGVRKYSATLTVTWRDVTVSVKGICRASSVAGLAVAA
ncbi:hypothetical protein ABZ070_19380 [Streptomyces sp. NPDC006283]|uniref:hypothetical protein n=1 Tax=Streptomyces sp. NPDC006283 TaxID=3156741 RepID=UPI0033AF2A8C